MIFDKNQTDFKDCIREAVWELGTRQLPLEMTLSYVPDKLKSACTDWYNFNQNLFTDMYENPDRFGFEINPSQPGWVNKKQVVFYHWLIGHLLLSVAGNHCEMQTGAFKKMIEKFNPKSVEALKTHHGFVIEEKGDIVVVYNHLYPGMLVGAKSINEAGRVNYKVNCDDFRSYCDFRGLAGYKRTYEDLHLVLNDENRRIAEKLHEYNVSRKIMPQKCYYFFRAEYKYKGKRVCQIDLAEKNRFKINMFFAEKGNEAFKTLESEIEKYDDAAEFKSFIVKNFSKCQNCKPVCWKKTTPREVFGKKFFACSTHITIYNPKEQDLSYIFKLLDLRKMVVEAGLA
jgi:hypothetical protein